jgi:hypothetical protein
MKVTGIYFENSTQQTVPAKNSMCWKLSGILGFLPKFKINDNG